MSRPDGWKTQYPLGGDATKMTYDQQQAHLTYEEGASAAFRWVKKRLEEEEVRFSPGHKGREWDLKALITLEAFRKAEIEPLLREDEGVDSSTTDGKVE